MNLRSLKSEVRRDRGERLLQWLDKQLVNLGIWTHHFEEHPVEGIEAVIRMLEDMALDPAISERARDLMHQANQKALRYEWFLRDPSRLKWASRFETKEELEKNITEAMRNDPW